ncbi:hypothetical protein T4C_2846 [Trichinella pseudospiralis]|uniref:Uncharacterized protein n=1 Tax=Trichinella pseudospiralis TaxID=6337 RepID=A0A0V1J6R3_TRIPS|nr:hypothetical protein T4C_2846 [Trichinella pseudospiralis]
MSLLILTEASIPEVNLIRICFNILLIQIKFFILTEINSFTPTTITSKQNIFYIYFFINYMRYGSFDFSCAELFVYIALDYKCKLKEFNVL